MRTFKNIFFIMLIITGLGFAQVKYTWNGGTGSWQTASNWNPNGVPGSADTAVVNSGTVTTDQAVTVAGIFQNGGIINGTNNISITANFIWVSGTQGGTGTTTIASTGTGIFTTQNGKTLSRIFVIDGLLEVQSSGTVSFSTGAQVINNGTIDFQINISFGNSNGTIVNNGTIINSSAGGGGILGAPFTNNGTVNIKSGELSSSGGITGSGSFVIAEGRKFKITSGTSTIGGNSISGSGTFEIQSATLNITGNAVTISSGTTLLQTSGTIDGDGSLIINGTINWVSGTQGGTGTTTIASTGTGIFTTQNGKTLSRIFVIDGLLDVLGSGSVSFSTGAQVINNGTIDFKTTVSFGNSNGTIVNNGTLLNSAASGGGTLAAPFTNNGTVNVLSGELSSSGGLTGSGSFVIAGARKFRITAGTSTIGGNSISGGGTFELITGTLNLSGSAVSVASGTTFLQSSGSIGGDGSLMINGSFNWAAGTQSGTGTTTISSSGTGSITSTSGKTISRTFVVDGLLDVLGSGSVSFSTGAQVINNGTIDFKTTVSFGNSNGTIVNNGTLLNSAASGGGTLAAPFTNNGLIQINSGIIGFTDTLRNNLTAELKGVGTLTTPTGNRFINNGTVAPGVSPGILNINGNYPHTTSAILNIEIGGYQVGGERDSLFISGQAQLDGTLNIQFINNFLPQVGDVFNIMRYGSRVGQFSQINFSNNVSGEIQYLSNGAQVLITNGGVNQSPIAFDDTAQTSEDVAVLINVLANDSDPDNDPLSINGFIQPIHGTAVQSGDSSISYMPALNFFGLDSLNYTIRDPNGATATAKVRITILPVNDPPTAPVLVLPANGDTLNPGQSINFVWNSSYDVENNPLTYSLRIWGGSLDTTIAGLTDTTFTFNNPNAFQQNNVYQWQVTASDGSLSTPSTIRNFFIENTVMVGVYTIGVGGDFTTINAAVTALRTFGVGGAVTFNILSGVYSEQVVIENVAGLSASSPVIFQSQTGNPEDVAWKYVGQSLSSNYVLLLKNISHITIRNITITASNNFAGTLVAFGTNSSNLVVENNNFIGVSTSSTSADYAVLRSSDAQIDNITIAGNKINFGSHAMRFSGTTQSVSNIFINNNVLIKQSLFSIFAYKVSNIQIKNNISDNRNQTGEGIRLISCYLPIEIIGNKVLNEKIGISLGLNSGGSGELLVSNNYIEVGVPQNYNYTPFGIHSASNQSLKLFYNTVVMSGDSVATSRALWVDTPTDVPEIKNNILVNTAKGRALYYSGSTGIQSDYNDLYTNGNILVIWNSSNYSSLTAYQTARNQDLNSLNVNPSFLSAGNPHLNDFILNNAGIPLAEVTTDIDGEPRHPNTPDIGADEFEPQGFVGEFTIGDGGDFPTITAAVQTLGDTIVTGPVTFNILPGIYDEQVVIDSVNRVIPDSPIIFQSQSGNAEDVVWGYSQQSSASNYVLLLREVSNITLQKISFKALSPDAGRLIGLGTNTTNIRIEANNFIGLATSVVSTGYAIINALAIGLMGIEIINNKFENGSFGLWLYSYAGDGFKIINNEFNNQSSTSIYLELMRNIEISKNKINNLANRGSGIRIAKVVEPILISDNRIITTGLGMLINHFSAESSTAFIFNNLINIVGVEDTSNKNLTAYGIRIIPTSSLNSHIYHNSIRLSGLPKQNNRCLAIDPSTGTAHNVKNNILINEMGGIAFGIYDVGTTSNYNDLYTTGTTLVKWNNVNYSSLSSYQTATGQDLNSISADPLFVSDTDLHIKSGSPVDGKGTPLAQVPRDIDNQLRSLTTPDIGADEYTQQRVIIKRRNNLKQNIAQGNNRDSIYIDPRLESMMSGYTLVDVNVFIDTLFHTNLADLEISLLHNGLTDTLANFLPDSSSGFINTILDDSASTDLNEGVSPFTGSYRPYNPLSVFNGIDPEGDWVLQVYDRSSNNSGILDAWGIELVFEIATGVEDDEEITILPDNFELSQNYPNPFNPSTNIRYSVPERSNVVLKIYDILGSEVSTLVNEDKDAGIYTANFNASQLASGIYFYRMQAGSFVETKKMILIK